MQIEMFPLFKVVQNSGVLRVCSNLKFFQCPPMAVMLSSTCCPSPSIASQAFLLHSLGMSSPAQKFETGRFFDPHSNVIIFELATKVQNLEDSIFSTSEKQEDLAMPGLVSLNDICG